MSCRAVVLPPAFPPSLVVQVKALACELPHRLGLPLSRLSLAELRRHVVTQGLVAEISGASLWRWLSSDALRPWQHRSWIFPRDPEFAAKAGQVLDLYERVWEGSPLGVDDFVLSADEKTSVQARRRKQPTLAPASARPMRVEHEYFRQGGLARTPNEHIAFGKGEHFCAGAHLARLELRLMLSDLLNRIEHVELAGKVERLK